jgi:hypothetical protein
VREFFRQHHSISLVVLVTVEEYGRNYSRDRKYRLRLTAMPSGCAAKDDQGLESKIASFFEALRTGLASLPEPIQTPRNAAIRLREQGFGPDMIGGYEMSDRRVRISVRALQRLLAGKIDYREFAEAHSWGDAANAKNPFLAALDRGEMIVSSAIVKEANRDDDWIALEFGGDAAVRKFSLPK